MSRLKDLIHEIHRRSLWQLLLIYCGAALVAYQAVQALTDPALRHWRRAMRIRAFLLLLAAAGLAAPLAAQEQDALQEEPWAMYQRYGHFEDYVKGGEVQPQWMDSSGVIYRNPRVYNVEFTFEMTPDATTIDRREDLRVWAPIPREWDSQKHVEILSVVPEPHARYDDPEYGNRIYYWDFGKEPEHTSYQVRVAFRLESYEIQAVIDTARIEPYDTTSEEYRFYTKSGHTTHITPEIRDLARQAVDHERNPYLQAQRIFEFVQERMRFEQTMERGIDFLLTAAAVDEETGEPYFRGACGQYSALFVALARAAGIPARSVQGYVGWAPHLNRSNSRTSTPLDTMVTAEGFAGAEHYGLRPHVWAEFLLPGYGWIPVDPTWGTFGDRPNRKVILSKGRDVLLGPDAPQAHHGGYGFQWVPIFQGRADVFVSPVWNIGKIRKARVDVYHTLDPFPADAFAGYLAVPAFADPSAIAPAFDGRELLQVIDDLTRDRPDKVDAIAEAIGERPWLREDLDGFIIHMFRRIVGDEAFLEIYDAYKQSRLGSGEPVPTRRFQEIAEEVHGEPLDWFFSQWLEGGAVPQLSLEQVDVSNENGEWLIRLKLRQLNDSVLRLPVQLEIRTEGKTKIENVWIDSREASFEFTTPDRPERITVDPEYDLLKAQKMPPVLGDLWSGWPDSLLVVYGTLAEGPANRAAAEGFNKGFLGLDDRVVKADREVSEKDLNTRVLILFGRPETNLLAQRFAEEFPVRFDEGRFSYGGVSYDEPTQGVAQVIEKPGDSRGLIIMYAGLSGEATRSVCDKSAWREELGGWFLIDLNASYVIYDADGHQRLLSGDWEGFDGNLVWIFNEPSGDENF